jgi:hypothetical protein
MKPKDYILLLAMAALCALLQPNSKTLRDHSDAPGAQTPPQASQVGKPDPAHPGGTFQCQKKNEHYALFPDRDGHKLKPGSARMHQDQHAHRISFGIQRVGNNLFNIIQIITKQTAIHSLASTHQAAAVSYPQIHKVIHIPILGISPDLGHIPILRTIQLVTKLKMPVSFPLARRNCVPSSYSAR